MRLSAPPTSTNWVKRRIKYLESGQPIYPINLLCVTVVTATPKYISHNVHDMCVMMEREFQQFPREVSGMIALDPLMVGPAPDRAPKPTNLPVLAIIASTGGPLRIREIFDPGGV